MIFAGMRDLGVGVPQCAYGKLRQYFNRVFMCHPRSAFIILDERSTKALVQPREKGFGRMVLRMAEGSKIENPRGYAAHAIEDLWQLLATGISGQRDPRRENFYAIEGAKDTYFIYISPITGNVVLLAKWSRERQPREYCLDAKHLVALGIK